MRRNPLSSCLLTSISMTTQSRSNAFEPSSRTRYGVSGSGGPFRRLGARPSEGATRGRTCMTTDLEPTAAAVSGDTHPQQCTHSVARAQRAAGDRRPRGRRVRGQGGAAPAADAGDDRLGELRPGRRDAGAGQRADQQVRRGLPRPPLLRRLRERRRHRDAGHRAGQGPVRGRFRERAAALGRAGERGRDGRADQAGRHHPGPVPGARRAPDPRHADQLLRAALQRRGVRGVQGGLPHRHGRGRQAGPAVPAETDHRRLVGLPAAPGLRAVPADRRRGRRAADGRHGPLRRAGRDRPAPESRCRTRM